MFERRGVTFCDDQFYNFDIDELNLDIEGWEFGPDPTTPVVLPPNSPESSSEDSSSESSPSSDHEPVHSVEVPPARKSKRVAEKELIERRKGYSKDLYFKTYNEVGDEFIHQGKTMNEVTEREADAEALHRLDVFYADTTNLAFFMQEQSE